MEVKFLQVALDILEGIAAGGLVGLGTYIMASAASSLPGAFISSSGVNHLSVVAGALGFIGFVMPNIRKRISYLEIDESKRINESQKIDESKRINESQKIDESKRINESQKIDESKRINESQKIDESKRINESQNNLTSTTSANPGATLVQIYLVGIKTLPDLRDIFSNKESSEILADRDTIGKNTNDLMEDKVSK